MALTIDSANGKERTFAKETGITSGNEFIWKVPRNAIISVQGLVTSAGVATVKYSLDKDEPTDLSEFIDSDAGAHSSNFGESTELVKGVQWIAVEVTSGTWTAILTAIKDTDKYIN